ncbi:hypothetical protein SKAU_G00144140 [Synaphobranchus kaupii]|uniref:Uncharacterized protein n=1 Tax=Synaphobranchus kaupii TaxID=118154 RepID=A0A9Q1J4K1_SYNKA|nr:hypothetical protein SKAU_G00144140 [Synaphobranchus kaupii]
MGLGSQNPFGEREEGDDTGPDRRLPDFADFNAMHGCGVSARQRALRAPGLSAPACLAPAALSHCAPAPQHTAELSLC